ncbi:MAG: aminopeptidase P N-terminal domain-containing protein [Prevotella sp.]|nr:aminopeptidase P N-terminal domain-containing protein [Prevotella sp.]MBR0523750.1 aminopeptidase P N-terminal domain-containing protein [Prevotella sp.]
MFSKEVYVNRRAELKTLVKEGVIILFGNNESPCNYPGNAYYPFRQDSSFLYYFGQKRDGLVGVIDCDNNKECLIGDDIDIDDIVWFGSVDSVADLAEQVGVAHSAPMKTLQEICDAAKKSNRKIHFLPPYRYDTKIQIMDLLGIHPSKQKEAASLELIMAIVKMRQCKTDIEIAEIEKACHVGYCMHTRAMQLVKPGVTEKYIGGQVDGMAHSLGMHESFATIFTQHGEIMHGNPSFNVLEDGRLALCDAGAENAEFYCSDNTRTMPVNGKFSQRQLEIYSIVEACHDYALTVAKPGVRWYDVHMNVCRLMTDKLKELGLMKGDTEAAVQAGAHAMFMPHGLGHMMGMDVHDMEGLGQQYVGFDEETQPSTIFGTASLRCGKRLQEGFVMTDEPGIYFIPALIDEWRAKKMHMDFLNYDMLETYKDFGGIRLEDDILITKDGCRFLGDERIPYHPKDVEEYMYQFK